MSQCSPPASCPSPEALFPLMSAKGSYPQRLAVSDHVRVRAKCQNKTAHSSRRCGYGGLCGGQSSGNRSWVRGLLHVPPAHPGPAFPTGPAAHARGKPRLGRRRPTWVPGSLRRRSRCMVGWDQAGPRDPGGAGEPGPRGRVSLAVAFMRRDTGPETMV